MEWNEIRSQVDVGHLMRAIEHFHDWYLAGIKYDPLARADDGSKNLARFMSETDALTILLRYDSTDDRGDWPEIELQFLGVYRMGFGPLKEPDPFYECWLEETTRGWAFVGENPLTDEERAHPQKVKSNLYAIGSEVRWRLVSGSLWAQERRRAVMSWGA